MPAATPPPALAARLRALRRAHRLSQLALAECSGVSQRHLSAIESGRAQAGRAVLLKLAGALQLPLTECNRLLQAGGYAAAYPRRPLSDAAMQPVREALQRQLAHHEPYPAFVVDRASHLLMANTSCERVLALLPEPATLWQRCCGEGVFNTLMLTLHPEGLRRHLLNPDEIIPPLLARAAREAVDDAEAERVLAVVSAYPGLPRREAVLASATTPVLCERYAFGTRRLSLFSLTACFGSPADETTDVLRIESFFPADDESERLLRQLAASAAPTKKPGVSRAS